MPLGSQENCVNSRVPDVEFVQLLTSAQCSLQAFAVAMLGGDRKHAEDIVQDANALIWEKRAQYDKDRPFLPWAQAFVFNRVRAFRRDSARGKLMFSDKLVAELQDRWEQAITPDSTARDFLRLCVDKLEQPEKQLLDKRYKNEFAVSAIANDSGATAGSIAKRLFRIREKLRRCIRSRIAQAAHA